MLSKNLICDFLFFELFRVRQGIEGILGEIQKNPIRSDGLLHENG